jgi:hypothetical protein
MQPMQKEKVDNRRWFALIWLFEHGVTISASSFAKLVGIASSTAWTMFKKVAIVVEDKMDGESVPSSSFCEIFCKRSRETPARAHPLAEQEELEEHFCNNNQTSKSCASDFEAESVAAAFEFPLSVHSEAKRGKALVLGDDSKKETQENVLGGEEKLVYDCLSKEPIHFDRLCQKMGMKAGKLSAILMLLELDGHVKRMAGDRYSRVDPEFIGLSQIHSRGKGNLALAVNLVPAIVEFVRKTFHGISRKYLQNYLAIYWCFMDRVQWPRGSLLEACIGFRYIGYNEILQYVSPCSVKVAGNQAG